MYRPHRELKGEGEEEEKLESEDDCGICMEMAQIVCILLHGTAAMYFSIRYLLTPVSGLRKYVLFLDLSFVMSFGAYYYWYWYSQGRDVGIWQHRMRKSGPRSVALIFGGCVVAYGVSCIGDLLLY